MKKPSLCRWCFVGTGRKGDVSFGLYVSSCGMLYNHVKYASAKLKLSGNETTFLMALGTSFFTLFYLPFADRFFTMSWQSFAVVILMAFLKFAEIELSVKILREMSESMAGHFTVFVIYA